MSTQKYPPSEGWLTLTLTMKDATPHGVDEIKKFTSGMTGKKPSDYEWGPVSQHGKKIKIVYRDPKRLEPAVK